MKPVAVWPRADARNDRRSSVQTSWSIASSQANSPLARPRPSLIRRSASSFPRRCGMTTTSGSDICSPSRQDVGMSPTRRKPRRDAKFPRITVSLALKEGNAFMPLSDTIKTLIRNAWDDGYPCLVATNGPQGPNITPKGSMIVFDDEHLAWWERSKRAVLENLGHDKRICVMYASFKAQRDGILESGFLRFFGSVELHETGPMREAIFAKLLPREQTHVGAEAGIGVLIKIEKAIDVRGKPIM